MTGKRRMKLLTSGLSRSTGRSSGEERSSLGTFKTRLLLQHDATPVNGHRSATVRPYSSTNKNSRAVQRMNQVAK